MNTIWDYIALSLVAGITCTADAENVAAWFIVSAALLALLFVAMYCAAIIGYRKLRSARRWRKREQKVG